MMVPAVKIASVIVWSCVLGKGFPCVWLWATMMWSELKIRAVLYISRILAEAYFIKPCPSTFLPISSLFVLKHSTKNLSSLRYRISSISSSAISIDVLYLCNGQVLCINILRPSSMAALSFETAFSLSPYAFSYSPGAEIALNKSCLSL